MDSDSDSSDDLSIDRFLTGHNQTYEHHNEIIPKNNNEILRRLQYPLVSDTFIISYLSSVIALGILMCALVCISYVINRNKKGIYTFILQVSLSDLLSLTVVAIPELWSLQSGNWTFGSRMCHLYLSLEVFTTTSNIYFLIAVNLHALATSNISRKYCKSDKNVEKELLDDSAEIRSSQHSLVSRSETLQSRRQILKEKPKQNNVPVLLPSIFVWILSISLIVPVLPLATVIDTRSGISMCTFLDGYHLTSVLILLIVFQLLVPFVILSVSSALIIYKLWTISSIRKDDSVIGLKIALFMCSLFLVFSVPRFLLASLHGLWLGNKKGAVGMDRFMFPPLNYNMSPMYIPLVLSFIHFLTPMLKPFGYIYFLKKSKQKNYSSIRKNKLLEADTVTVGQL